jgi:hemerythrin
MEKKIILWTEALQTGIEWQDYQHREFLDMTNRIFEFFYNNQGHIDIAGTVEYLERYVRDHFAIEERYMRRFNYPKSREHLKQHEAFEGFIEDIKSRAKDSVLEAGRICNKLNHWFAGHIKGEDTQLGAFLREQGQR